jgi:hypothetical protein
MDWIWRISQAVVFVSVVLFFDDAADHQFPVGAIILALGITAIVFAPFLHLEQWLLRRRERRRSHHNLQGDLLRPHKRLNQRRAPGVSSKVGSRPRKRLVS